MSGDLVAFLRARYDEDEAVARRAFEYASPVWHLDEHGETVLWWPPESHVAENERKHGLPVTADQWRGVTIDAGGARIGPHIVRHDPARVLREIEAKRRILRAHEKWCEGRCEAKCPEEGFDAAHYWSIKSLAAVYDDHDDYRDEWRP